MPAAMVYDGIRTSSEHSGALFAGQKIFFSRNIPQRKWLIENAQENGAVTVSDESEADVVLVDHAKRPAAPGTHSYRYVEHSIRNGALEHLADHAVGASSRSNRVVGSVTTASRGTRKPFTDEHDQILWDWVKPLEDAGGATGGNAIYQQLEAVNDAHTFQSWRDRWLKHVRFQNRTTSNADIRDQTKDERVRSGPQVSNGDMSRVPKRPSIRETTDRDSNRPPAGLLPSTRSPRTPGITPEQSKHTAQNHVPEPQQPSPPVSVNAKLGHISAGSAAFEPDEVKQLHRGPIRVLNTDDDSLAYSWRRLAEAFPGHTAEQLRHYFDTNIAPLYKLKTTNELTNVEPVEIQSNSKVRKNQADHESASSSPNTAAPQSNVRAQRSKHIMTNAGGTSMPQSDDESPPITATIKSAVFREQQPEALTDHQPTKPSEARKRSSQKVNNTQDSPQVSTSQRPHATATQAAEPWHSSFPTISSRSSPLKRKRVVSNNESPTSPIMPSLEDLLTSQRLKRTKRVHTPEATEVEIPPTPPGGVEGTTQHEFVYTSREDFEIIEILQDEELDVTLPVLKPSRDSLTPSMNSESTDLVHGRQKSHSPIPKTSPLKRATSRQGTKSPLLVIPKTTPETIEKNTETIDHSSRLEGNGDAGIGFIERLIESNKQLSQRTVERSLPKVNTSGEVEIARADIHSHHPSEHQWMENTSTSSEHQVDPQHVDMDGENDEVRGMTQFETAPTDQHDSIEAWETARDGTKQQDTASNSGTATLQAETQIRPDTQALFQPNITDDPDETNDWSALPEPEGGWSSPARPENTEAEPAKSNTTHETMISVPQPPTIHLPAPPSIPTQIDRFVDDQLAANPEVDEEYLLMAIDATCFDTALVPRVYQALTDTDGRDMPRNLRGVWTAHDDELLWGDARGIEIVQRKHGSEGVKRRWAWREGGDM